MTTQQVLDKQGLQHYATKMCNAENRKVGSKSLPTALNDIDIAIDGFKTLFDNEYGTPVTATIENNSNSFTVGVGNGIDKSNDVENSFTDIELSGNSMVNLIDKAKHCSQHPNYYTIEGNCVVNKTGNDSRGWDTYPILLILKPNTTYTAIIKNKISNQTRIQLHFSKNKQQTAPEYTLSAENIGDTIIQKHTTKNDAYHFAFKVYSYSTPTEKCGVEIMLFEGDYTNKPIPSYFEGLKSIGENEENKINISSIGKNLYKPVLNTWGNSSKGIILISQNDVEYINGTATDTIDIRPVYFNNTTIKDLKLYEAINSMPIGTTLTLSNSAGLQNYWIVDKLDGTVLYPNNTYIKSKDDKRVTCFVRIVSGQSFNNTPLNIQIEFGNKTTSYESYKEDKKEILLNEPLRGINDNVKDTIEKIDGEWKIVRRCGEITLDDNLAWYFNNTENTHLNTNRFITSIPQNKGAVAKYPFVGICDTLPVYANWSDTAHLGVTLGSPRTIFVYKKEYTDAAAFTRWIKENPAKVIYKLETPIIENIDPVVLQCWKNGSIFIDEPLPVTTTHTVALNKTAQIQSNIEELTSLRNRVQKIEEQYNSTVLTQAYETILLNFDMNL